MNERRWQTLMDQLAGKLCLATYRQLVRAYAEPHRYYHTADHIEACLHHFDGVKTLAQSPVEVEIAIWFHDAVYQTQSHQNEQKSADWAARFLHQAGVAQDRCHRVHHLIMTTHKHEAQDDQDPALMIDIDLAILGQDAQTFADFEVNIRQEYTWVPAVQYCQRRSEILETFLQRPYVYQTAYFQERYEAVARANLQTAISRLQAGILPDIEDNG